MLEIGVFLRSPIDAFLGQDKFGDVRFHVRYDGFWL